MARLMNPQPKTRGLPPALVYPGRMHPNPAHAPAPPAAQTHTPALLAAQGFFLWLGG